MKQLQGPDEVKTVVTTWLQANTIETVVDLALGYTSEDVVEMAEALATRHRRARQASHEAGGR